MSRVKEQGSHAIVEPLAEFKSFEDVSRMLGLPLRERAWEIYDKGQHCQELEPDQPNRGLSLPAEEEASE